MRAFSGPAVCCATFALAAGALLAAPEAARSQSLRGRLLEAGSPAAIDGGTVRLLDEEGTVVAQTMSGDSGRFALEAPRAGEFSLHAERLGYLAATGGPIRLAEGDTVSVEFRLSADAVELEPLSVVSSARSDWLRDAGFYRRMENGFGHYITRDEILAAPVAYTSDLLRRVPGVRLQPRRFGGNRVVLRSGRGCGARVFVDGVRLVTRGDVDLVVPTDIEGIEVYRGTSEVPAEFGGVGSGCGVIVIWTRDPTQP